ncbi:MAG: glycosyl transferase family 2, partial [Bacteroidota bacterium]|nr:glycosyl transferase family 2 [Bacteroidota bacterium]
GKAYMGVGRNLAYRKSVFYRYGGFTAHYKISSGDDDLFINKISNKYNTKIEYAVEAHTISAPKRNFSLWFRQKKRHLSTGKYYKLFFKMLFGFNTVSLFTFYFTFFWLVFVATDVLLYISLGVFSSVIISQLLIFYFGFIRLNNTKSWLLSPLFEIFFVLFNPLFYSTNLVNKNNKWK